MWKEEEFREVTLVREDQGGCGGHKVVLSSTSPTEEDEVTLAGRQVVPGVIMKLSPKQEAALEKAYMFGCYGKDPKEQGLKDIANWVLKPKGTVEQVEAWFEARRARGARGEEVEVKEEEVKEVEVKKVPKKKVKKVKKVKGKKEKKVEEVNVPEVKVEDMKEEEGIVEETVVEEVLEEETLVKVEEGMAEEVIVEEWFEAAEEVEVLEEGLVEKKLGEEVEARSNSFSLRQASTPSPSLPPTSPSTSFWRPWEGSCEATAASEWSGEATTHLSSVGVTPPALVTPSREEVRSTGRKVGRRLRRLLTFQATLEKEKGLPPSRWQRRLETGEEGEATLLNTPVSHRRRGRRRGGMGEAEASSPKLRRSRVECTNTPYTPGGRGLEASRYSSTLLHSSLTPGGWDGGGHRAFCWQCESWGNMVPM